MGVRTEGSTGTRVPVSPPSSFTGDVLTDVVLERHRQVQLHGHNEDTADGTGPEVRWLGGTEVNLDLRTATELERVLRAEYDGFSKAHPGQSITFMRLLREEVAEAFKEDDPAALYAELVQVAAVAVSWCEKLRARG